MPQLRTEEELEQYIFDSFGSDFDWGWFEGDVLLRQFCISGYGVADLVKVSVAPGYNGRKNIPELNITVMELKKDEVKLDAVGQICRYRTGISRALDKMRNRNGNILFTYEIEGILIGKEYDSGDVCYVVDNTDWLSTYTFDISLSDGISFSSDAGWYSTKEKDSVVVNSEIFKEFKSMLRYCVKANRKEAKVNV